MMRYKALIDRRLHVRTLPTQKTEAAVGCKVINIMICLGCQYPSASPEPQPQGLMWPALSCVPKSVHAAQCRCDCNRPLAHFLYAEIVNAIDQ
jgi:hypothetical protein